MTRARIVRTSSAALLALTTTITAHANEPAASTGAWEGVWVAEADFGPRFDGPVTLHRTANGWVAEIQGERASVVQTAQADGATQWAFEIPNQGHFIGKKATGDGTVTGHWFQPPGPVQSYPFASPLALTPAGPDALTGTLRPFRQSVSMNIVLTPAPDADEPASDRYRTFLRNPERNLGRWFRIDTAVADGSTITFYDRDGEALAVANSTDEGRRFTLLYGRFGMTMDFTRRPRHDAPGFYPQRTATPVDSLLRPPQLDDGWETATAASAGFDEGPLLEMLNDIRAFEPEELSAPYFHGLLIAHRGKLVFESYFHGFHRDRPHDSRSAGKSLASVLLGVAIETGAIASVDTPVYDFFGGVEAFAN
ncbi:MAG: hypothetical protein AAFX85_12615, partial [Pseudomonadota bacterium]